MRPPVIDPVDRETLEAMVRQELGRLCAVAPTLAAVNRARRVIMAAADAYRAWLPDADPPTPTQRLMASERCREVRAVLYAVRNDHERLS